METSRKYPAYLTLLAITTALLAALAFATVMARPVQRTEAAPVAQLAQPVPAPVVTSGTAGFAAAGCTVLTLNEREGPVRPAAGSTTINEAEIIKVVSTCGTAEIEETNFQIFTIHCTKQDTLNAAPVCVGSVQASVQDKP